MPRVKVVAETGEAKTVEFEADLYIGRDKSNDIVLTDPSCSRHHALIRRHGDGYAVTDLGSNNGVLVNGRRVTQQALRSGDRIQLGHVTLVYEEGATTQVVEVEADDLTVKATSICTRPEPGKRLKDLYDILRAVSGRVGTRDTLEALCDSLRAALQCDVVAAVGREELVCSSARPVRISRSLVDAGRAQASLFSGADIQSKQSVIQERIASVLCGPIDALWTLYADSRDPKRTFSQDDLEFFTAASMQAALALRGAALFDRTKSEVQELKRYYTDSGRLIGRSPKFIEALAVARKAAAADSTVLILGESGTGKELIARLIHESSPRASGPFVALNCAALVETLLESELFGYEKGAFTGATRTRPGKFEAAEGGTLFLDEIGELSAATQAKLLRALQERKFYRVGGVEPISVDVRIIAATNRPLQNFREDLYYRLAVLKIELPPLRERREDISILANHFLQLFAAQMKKPVKKVSAAALDRLQSYGWPGNVRELQNVIERAVVLADGETITPELIPLDARATTTDLPLNLEEAEKMLIKRALEQTGYKKGEAIKLLGISWPTLNKKLKDYGLE